MNVFFQQLHHFKSSLKPEYIYNAFLIFIIVLILLLALVAVFQPVEPSQRQYVIRLAQQATYPKTQRMAQLLLQHEPVQRGSYLKLMQGYQFEQDQVKHYPAIAIEDMQ